MRFHVITANLSTHLRSSKTKIILYLFYINFSKIKIWEDFPQDLRDLNLILRQKP